MRLNFVLASVLLFILLNSSLYAQVELQLESLPQTTPANASFYAAGSFNGWNPNSAQHKFLLSNGKWILNLPAGTGSAEFKITRGSWETVEGTSTGGFTPNRTFTYQPNLSIKIQIAGWEDQKSGGNSTALPQVRKIDFFIPQLNLTRKVWIYLPSDYAQTTKRYPVLYLQDAQNVFDNATAFAGEWGVDESLDAREKAGKSSAIVVAVEHGNSERLNEYSPYINPSYGGGQGELYVDFLANNLKPFIDSVYRTLKSPMQTAIGGSSMGGLISMYAVLKYPNIFGKGLIFSPAFWFSDSLFNFAAAVNPNSVLKIAFMCDDSESKDMVPDMLRMKNLLLAKGVDSANISYQIKSDGAHSEWFWKREFPSAFEFLFPENTVNGLDFFSGNPSAFEIFPNPLHDTDLFWRSSANPDSIKLLTKDGRTILTFSGQEIKAGQPLKIQGVAWGNYSLLVTIGQKRYLLPLIIAPR